MCCLRNGATKKEPELARHLPLQVFPEATSVIQNTLHHKCQYHQQPPLKRKTKPKKKANSPKSVKTEVGLTLEIRILRKKTPGVALTRKQSMYRVPSTVLSGLSRLFLKIHRPHTEQYHLNGEE